MAAIFMKQELFLPREHYDQEAQKHGPQPWVFEIEHSTQSLFYFGANHSRNPNDPQYPALRSYWSRFLNTTHGKDRIALIEGGMREIPEDENSAIINSSEAGLVILLAHKENIAVTSPDIPLSKTLEILFHQNEGAARMYQFLSHFSMYKRLPDPRTDFITWFHQWSTKQQSIAIWKDVEITLPYVKHLYHTILGTEFNQEIALEDLLRLVNPNRTDTAINRIAQQSSNMRDLHIAEEIERCWKSGKSIFSVFGAGHLIIQKPALEITLQ